MFVQNLLIRSCVWDFSDRVTFDFSVAKTFIDIFVCCLKIEKTILSILYNYYMLESLNEHYTTDTVLSINAFYCISIIPYILG